MGLNGSPVARHMVSPCGQPWDDERRQVPLRHFGIQFLQKKKALERAGNEIG
jgi:hypothetical protein